MRARPYRSATSQPSRQRVVAVTPAARASAIVIVVQASARRIQGRRRAARMPVERFRDLRVVAPLGARRNVGTGAAPWIELSHLAAARSPADPMRA